MPSSLKFVIGALLVAALCVPASLAIQHSQMQHQAQLLAARATGGRPSLGKLTVRRLGCDACHQIEGVPGADGQVGPSLKALTDRAEFGGKAPNDAQSLINWIEHPQSVSPGVGMPDIPMSDQDARDMAAYLYTLRGS
jgi:cytochrome c2